MSARVLFGVVLLLLTEEEEEEDAIRGSFTAALSTIAGAGVLTAPALLWATTSRLDEVEGFAGTGRVRTRGPCADSPEEGEEPSAAISAQCGEQK